MKPCGRARELLAEALLVEAVHRRLYAVQEDGLYRARGVRHGGAERLDLGRIGVAEDVPRDILRVPGGLAVHVRAADADADADEVRAADGGGDGADAVVSAVATPGLDADAAGRKV